MRVIAGKAKGHKLIAPKGMETRPTADFAKEALFSMLGTKVSEAKFLDLFSGSGAIGIEALSRGASMAYFVDHSRDGIAAAEKNLLHTKMNGAAYTLCEHVAHFLTKCPLRNLSFDIIFMDPPYGYGDTKRVLALIMENTVLAPEGIVIVEQAKNDPVVELPGLVVYKRKEYRTAAFIFYSPGTNGVNL